MSAKDDCPRIAEKNRRILLVSMLGDDLECPEASSRKTCDIDREKAENLIFAFQTVIRSIRRHYSSRPGLHHASWFYTANIIEDACQEIEGLWELQD